MEVVCPIDAQFVEQIALLLEPPSSHQVQEYFHELITSKQCNGIQVKPTNDYGKGVYADMEFEEGDLVLKDQMLVVEDLNLNAIGSLQGGPYLAIGKHLCGPATDMTLRCCVGENGSTCNLRGLSIATCCHHLCQWKHYINRGFFSSHGMSKDEFHAVTWFTSWAVDAADHASDLEEPDTKMY